MKLMKKIILSLMLISATFTCDLCSVHAETIATINHNKRELNALILSTSKYKVNDYTLSSYNNMVKAKVAAKKVVFNSKATQSDINTAYNTLNSAINSLEKFVQADKKLLQETINKYKNINLDDYNIKSKLNFEKALFNAEKVLLNKRASQEDVDNAINQLNNAYANLSKKITAADIERVKLDKLIKISNSINLDRYTSDSVENLKKQLNSAKEILSNPNATFDQLQIAYNKLKQAYLDLKLKNNGSAISDEIKKMIDDIENLKDNSLKVDLPTIDLGLEGIDKNNSLDISALKKLISDFEGLKSNFESLKDLKVNGSNVKPTSEKTYFFDETKKNLDNNHSNTTRSVIATSDKSNNYLFYLLLVVSGIVLIIFVLKSLKRKK